MFTVQVAAFLVPILCCCCCCGAAYFVYRSRQRKRKQGQVHQQGPVHQPAQAGWVNPDNTDQKY